jgi:hypothetical protein
MRLGPRGAWEASNCPPWSPSLWCRLSASLSLADSNRLISLASEFGLNP